MYPYVLGLENCPLCKPQEFSMGIRNPNDLIVRRAYWHCFATLNTRVLFFEEECVTIPVHPSRFKKNKTYWGWHWKTKLYGGKSKNSQHFFPFRGNQKEKWSARRTTFWPSKPLLWKAREMKLSAHSMEPANWRKILNGGKRDRVKCVEPTTSFRRAHCCIPSKGTRWFSDSEHEP